MKDANFEAIKHAAAEQFGLPDTDDPVEFRRLLDSALSSSSSATRTAFTIRVGRILGALEDQQSGMREQSAAAISQHAFDILTHAISELYAAVVTNLTVAYVSQMGSEDALLLAGSVLSEAMLEQPFTERAAKYEQAHSALVRQALDEVADDPDTVTALAYLYAAKTIQLAFITRSPYSDQARALCDRATELAIDIPSTFDICRSGDAVTCIDAIAAFAREYSDHAFARRRDGV